VEKDFHRGVRTDPEPLIIPIYGYDPLGASGLQRFSFSIQSNDETIDAEVKDLSQWLVS
jgi:hypothetical protein